MSYPGKPKVYDGPVSMLIDAAIEAWIEGDLRLAEHWCRFAWSRFEREAGADQIRRP